MTAERTLYRCGRERAVVPMELVAHREQISVLGVQDEEQAAEDDEGGTAHAADMTDQDRG